MQQLFGKIQERLSATALAAAEQQQQQSSSNTTATVATIFETGNNLIPCTGKNLLASGELHLYVVPSLVRLPWPSGRGNGPCYYLVRRQFGTASA